MFNHFYNTLPVVLRANFLIFPSYSIKIYHDGNIAGYYLKVLDKLVEERMLSVSLVEMPVLKCKSMLWKCLFGKKKIIMFFVEI